MAKANAGMVGAAADVKRLNRPKVIRHADRPINDSPRQSRPGPKWDADTTGAKLPKYPC